MKIFLSWSGENSQSHQVAIALHKWLPRVIQQLDPFLSSHDIDSGINWGPEVDKQLSEIHFGILAITRSSMLAPWLLFEAGALSKHVNQSYVCPYLFGIKPTDLDGPLGKLQSRESNQAGTLMLLETINKALPFDNRLASEVLHDQFEVWWPKLQIALNEIKSSDLNRCDIKLEKVREDRDLLEEILTITRDISSVNSYNNILFKRSDIYKLSKSKDDLIEKMVSEHTTLQELKEERAELVKMGKPTEQVDKAIEIVKELSINTRSTLQTISAALSKELEI